MSRATPKMRDFAERLIAYETKGNSSSAVKTPAAFHLCEKLRPYLVILMGKAGFRGLFSRALALANAEIQWLRAVHVKADGSLEGVEELHSQLRPDEFFEGGVELLAQLLELLVTFIGEELTLRLLREVWPKLPVDNSDFSKGVKNEKTK